MSGNNKEDRKRQANRFAVEIIRVDGTHETAAVDPDDWLKQIEQLISASCLDSVDLRDGRTMLVDDLGYSKGLPDNTEATALYHKVCKPGTTTESKVTSSWAEMRIFPEWTLGRQRGTGSGCAYYRQGTVYYQRQPFGELKCNERALFVD
jgi:hypothetical protein